MLMSALDFATLPNRVDPALPSAEHQLRRYDLTTLRQVRAARSGR